MKTLLYILIFHLPVICFAQDPELFERTWYLRMLHPDFESPYIVSEMDPPIRPHLIVSEDFTFSGEGACNSFTGLYNFFPLEEINTTFFEATTNDCGDPYLNRFEYFYFDFISGSFSYSLTQEGDEFVLLLYTGWDLAQFTSYPLSTADYLFNEVKIAANPVIETLVLNSKQEIGKLDLQIFTTEGKLLHTEKLSLKKQTSIDVSGFSRGMFFLKLLDENGKVAVKKFIKE